MSRSVFPHTLLSYSLLSSHFLLTIPTPHSLPLFPYTTLFRSRFGMVEVPGEAQSLVEILLRHFRAGRDLEAPRSEEHTSELQSRQYLVCRLLLEKENKLTSSRANFLKLIPNRYAPSLFSSFFC